MNTILNMPFRKKIRFSACYLTPYSQTLSRSLHIFAIRKFSRYFIAQWLV